MIEHIMCNAKIERCRLGDCGWLRLGESHHRGAALASCRLPSSVGTEPYGGRLGQPLTVFTIMGFLIRFLDAFQCYINVTRPLPSSPVGLTPKLTFATGLAHTDLTSSGRGIRPIRSDYLIKYFSTAR